MLTLRPPWLLFLALFLIAMVPTGTALPQGGPSQGGPVLQGNCVTSADRAHAEAAIRAFHARFGYPNPRPRGASPILYPFIPMAGTVVGDVMAYVYTDLNPSSPGIVDFDCDTWAYDGHRGHDLLVRSFAEQDGGVPIFAALDGTVADAHDGESDRWTDFEASRMANYVIVYHGGTHYTWYFHMRKNSVAVNVGQMVKAGAQLGLVASSGYSSWPHLHFQSMLKNTWFEPSAGPCRPGPSNWVNQIPIQRTLWLYEFDLTDTDMSTAPPVPHDIPRQGTFLLGSRVLTFRFVLGSLPTNSAYRIRYIRPDGSTRFDTGSQAFNNDRFYPYWWWWWLYTPDLDTLGTWKLELSVNGQVMVQAPFSVVANASQIVNRPPNVITASLDPPAPKEGDAVFCRVPVTVLDDPDYDLVRYRYQWRVNDNIVRDVTFAACSDALARDQIRAGDTVSCTVTPTDGQANGPPAQVQSIVGLNISGTVRENGAGLGSVTVSTGTRNAITAPDGTFTIQGLAAGNHTATPSRSGYIFSPTNRTVTVNADVTGVDFAASRPFSVSGRVLEGTAGLSGVAVSAGAVSTTTNAAGDYQLLLPAGAHTVVPAKSGYRFEPVNANVTVSPDATGVNFTATRVFSVSGRILVGSTGLSGVGVSAGGITTTTDGAGEYELGLPVGAYTIVPAKSGYRFEPVNANVTVGPDATGVNFTATRVFSVSGRILEGATGVSGVSVSAGGVTATTNTAGDYQLVLPAGAYTVVPAKSGYIFQPVNANVTLGPDATGVNFTAIRLFSVSGRILEGSTGLSGVTVSAGGVTATTNAAGDYQLVLSAGAYTVAPTRAGYSFQPVSANVTIGPDATGVNFSAVTAVPPAPSGLTAKADSSTQITLNWLDNSGNEIGFQVERSTDNGVTYSPVTTVAANVKTLTDPGRQASTEYTYRVRAKGSVGDSAWCTPASATTPGPPPPLKTLKVTPTGVRGGSPATGTLTLAKTATSPLAVMLRSSSSVAIVPASVTVAAGARSATFSITTQTVTRNTSVTLTATLGTVNKTAKLQIKR